jgi:CRP-like cAMP-binding protein
MHKQSDQLLLLEKVLALKAVAFFEETPETVLLEVASMLEEIQKVEGEVLFKEGEKGDCLYIISQGRVKIHKEAHVYAEMGPNDFFGELSLFDTEPRSASATVTSQDATLLKLKQQDFYDLIESRVEIVRGVMKVLCGRLRAQNVKNFEHRLKA